MRYRMDESMTAAATLMEQQRFHECIAAYENIVYNDPMHAPMAACQVGVAQFFLGQYALAIQWYEYAGRLGCEPEIVNDNIVEAREYLAQQGGAPAAGAPYPPAMAPQGQAPAPHPATPPVTQYGFNDDGSAWINVPGAGWQPYTHPYPGDVILAEDGSMWQCVSPGAWQPHSVDSAGMPPPQAGQSVFHMLANRFFIMQPDGSWRVRPE